MELVNKVLTKVRSFISETRNYIKEVFEKRSSIPILSSAEDLLFVFDNFESFKKLQIETISLKAMLLCLNTGEDLKEITDDLDDLYQDLRLISELFKINERTPVSKEAKEAIEFLNTGEISKHKLKEKLKGRGRPPAEIEESELNQKQTAKLFHCLRYAKAIPGYTNSGLANRLENLICYSPDNTEDHLKYTSLLSKDEKTGLTKILENALTELKQLTTKD